MLVTQVCLTLCDPMDCSPPGSFVHGIILGWGAAPFSRGSSQLRDQTQVFCIADRLFTIWSTRDAPRIPFLWIPKTKAFCFSLPERLASLTSSPIRGHISPPVPKDWGNYIHFPCSWTLTAITPLLCASHRHCLIWFTQQPHEGAVSGVFISLLIVQRKPYYRIHLVDRTWIWAPKEERTSNLWFVYFILV